MLIIQREQGVSEQRAIGHITAMAREHVERFLNLEHSIPALCRELRLNPGQTGHEHRYTEGMRHWMRDCYDWESATARYRADSRLPASGPGHLEELASPR
ncbi:hypothetical protein [Streptomyces griseocarneus]|uniref:hypothetical protein n=1 Tax=Streptomyces griseocarneus TaxID=51201 RepID=UPI00167CB4DB|nr:hypothetical protein [Streptomyces griseocarneus]MBZ6475039.1 hypothetical protein [Streptomyces griseocarneus]GHG62631.1 hypothetical protein GCM10018779_31480 [Streptomyces griseocarneus]